MKKFTKLMCALLAMVMVFGLVACGEKSNVDNTTGTTATTATTGTTGTTEPAVKVPNRAILGSTTELSGDFRSPGWGGSSAGASDQDINRLTVGYSTM